MHSNQFNVNLINNHLHQSHSNKWVLHHNGCNLCMGCCLLLMDDENETQFNRIQVICAFNEVFNSSQEVVESLFKSEESDVQQVAQTLVSTLMKVMSSRDQQMTQMASKCLFAIVTRAKNENMNVFIIENMIKRVCDRIESSLTELEFISFCIPVTKTTIELILSPDCGLISTLTSAFISSSYSIKLCIFHVFKEIYSKKTHSLSTLFSLDLTLHEDVVNLCLITLTNETRPDLCITSIALMRKLMEYELNVPILVNKEQFPDAVKMLLSSSDVDVITGATQMICALLQTGSNAYVSDLLVKHDFFNLFIELLKKSSTSLLNESIICCIKLALECINIDLIENYLMNASALNTINNVTVAAYQSGDEIYCEAALSVAVLLITKFQHIKFINDEMFYGSFKLLGLIVKKFGINQEVVNMVGVLLEPKNVPPLIDVSQIFQFFESIAHQTEIILRISSLPEKDVIKLLGVIQSFESFLNLSYLLIKQTDQNEGGRMALFHWDSSHSSSQSQQNFYDTLSQNPSNEINFFSSINEKSISDLIYLCLQTLDMLCSYLLHVFSNEYSFICICLMSKCSGCLKLFHELNLCVNEKISSLFKNLLSKKRLISFLWKLFLKEFNMEKKHQDSKKILGSALAQMVAFLMKEDSTLTVFQEAEIENIKRGVEIFIECDRQIDVILDVNSNYDQNLSHCHSAFFAISYYCILYDEGFIHDINFSEFLKTYILKSARLHTLSYITIKHLLFIAVMTSLNDDQSNICYVSPIILHINEMGISSYVYTNHWKMIEWAFKTQNNIETFGEMAIKLFIERIPDSFFNSKESIFKFLQMVNANDGIKSILFELISQNDPVHHVLSVSPDGDSARPDAALIVVEKIIFQYEDELCDDAEAHEVWHEFAKSVLMKLPFIISCILDNDYTSVSQSKASRLIHLLCQLRRSGGVYGRILHQDDVNLTDSICRYHLNCDSSITLKHASFWYLTQSLDSSINSKDISIARIIMKSGKFLLMSDEFLTKEVNDIELTEMAASMMSLLVKCKALFGIKSNWYFKYDQNAEFKSCYDLNLLCSWLKSSSKTLQLSAILIFTYGYELKIFAEAGGHHLKIRRFLCCLQNALCSRINFTEDAVNCFKKLLEELRVIDYDLLNHFICSPWFLILIEKNFMTDSFETLNDGFIDFLILFYSQQSINKHLKELTHFIKSKLREMKERVNFPPKWDQLEKCIQLSKY